MADLAGIKSFFGYGPSFKDCIMAAGWAKPTDSVVLVDGQFQAQSRRIPLDPEINERTWHAFRRCIETEFTENQIDSIYQRYGFDWNDRSFDLKPLERRYVEFFGVRAANPTLADLEGHLSIFRSLSKQDPKQLDQLFRKASRNRYIADLRDPMLVHGGPEEMHENFVHDFFLLDKHRANLFRGLTTLLSRDKNIPRLHPYYSRLEMAIVCLLETKKGEEDINMIIPAPGPRDGEVDYYKVHRIIARGGLTAFALVPVSESSSLSPILCFRCTSQTLGHVDAVFSILNDMETELGKSGYEQTKNELKDLMADRAFTGGKKIKVLCYSLGGAHAGYFLRDYWRQVKEFVGFNFVGSSDDVIDSIAHEINRLPAYEIPPEFYSYRNVCEKDDNEVIREDWVNKSMKKHLGFGISHPNAVVQVVEWILPRKECEPPNENVFDLHQQNLWMEIHGKRPMDAEPEYRIQGNLSPWRYKYNLYQGPTNCNRLLDTYARDPTMENKRKEMVQVAELVRWTYYILDFIFRIFRIELFRKNP